MKRTEITARLPVVFGLDRLEAAASIGVSATTFDALVLQRLMPTPRLINSRKVWDVDELRTAFKALPKDGENREAVNTWADVV